MQDIQPNFAPSAGVRVRKKSWWKITLLILGVVVLLAALGAAGYFYNQLRQLKKDPSVLSASETQATIDEVGKLIVLPTDETPTVATVTDPSQLKGQAFFANAQKGDIVLIYNNAQEAILYSPSMNKIVQVGPVSASDAAGTTPTTATATAPATPTTAPPTK